jgi:glycosyltransferase involved in cell wall biosynthesis
VKPGCSRSLAGVMNTLFADKALQDRFSRNARAHYAAHYSPAVQGDKYLAEYHALLRS